MTPRRMSFRALLAALACGPVVAIGAPISFAAPVYYPIDDYVSQLAVGDFTHDGNVDLAVLVGPGATLGILPGSATGAFGGLITTGVIYYIPSVIASGDLDGDGYPDVVLAGSHNLDGGPPYGVQSLLSAGAGAFTQLPYRTLPDTVHAMATGHFTSRTKLDLAMTVTQYSGASGIVLMPGKGGGQFGAGQFIALAGANPNGLAVADMNGDGKSDIVVSDETNARVWLLLGNGDGSFQAPLAIPASQGSTAVAVADLDGDGIPDIVAAGGTRVFSLLGHGDGTFGTAQSFNAGQFPQSIVAADFNCDGKVDVATADINGGGVALLQGNGDGTFAAPTFLDAGSEPVFIVAGDFNHDGRPDLAVANEISMNVSVYLNTGTGPARGCKVR